MQLTEKSDRQIFREETGEAIGVVCIFVHRGRTVIVKKISGQVPE